MDGNAVAKTKINRERKTKQKTSQKFSFSDLYSREVKEKQLKMEPRTLESAFRVVSLAKLEPESLQPCAQALRFSTAENTMENFDNLVLLEVNSKVADQLEQGQSFVFRGESDDSVVLCSNNEVFDVKEAETSNSLLIVKNLMDNESCANKVVQENGESHQVTVVKTFYRYYELKPLKPNFQKMMQILEERSLNSFPVDNLKDHSMEFDELLSRIQCSEKGT